MMEKKNNNELNNMDFYVFKCRKIKKINVSDCRLIFRSRQQNASDAMLRDDDEISNNG